LVCTQIQKPADVDATKIKSSLTSDGVLTVGASLHSPRHSPLLSPWRTVRCSERLCLSECRDVYCTRHSPLPRCCRTPSLSPSKSLPQPAPLELKPGVPLYQCLMSKFPSLAWCTSVVGTQAWCTSALCQSSQVPLDPKPGVPVFRDELGGQRRLHLCVDIGSMFKPSDVTIQVSTRHAPRRSAGFYHLSVSVSMSIKYLHSAKSRTSNLRRWRVGD